MESKMKKKQQQHKTPPRLMNKKQEKVTNMVDVNPKIFFKITLSINDINTPIKR